MYIELTADVIRYRLTWEWTRY